MASILSQPSFRTEPVRNTAAWACMVCKERRMIYFSLKFNRGQHEASINIKLALGYSLLLNSIQVTLIKYMLLWCLVTLLFKLLIHVQVIFLIHNVFVYLLHVEPDLRSSQTSIGEPQLVQVGHGLFSCTGLQRGQFLSWRESKTPVSNEASNKCALEHWYYPACRTQYWQSIGITRKQKVTSCLPFHFFLWCRHFCIIMLQCRTLKSKQKMRNHADKTHK